METIKQLSEALKVHGVTLDSLLCSTNSKVMKNEKEHKVRTVVLHLDPAEDKRVCPFATLCSALCLMESGNPAYWTGKKKARAARTRMVFEHRELFIFAVAVALGREYRKAIKAGLDFGCRLNGTSDLLWETFTITIADWMLPLLHKVGLKVQAGEVHTLFSLFSEVQFYDYTKVEARLYRELPSNYHLTFSLDGYVNAEAARRALNAGFNVAVPFYELPDTFHIDGQEFTVFDGDLSDWRPLDPKGQIVGLKYKRVTTRKAVNNGFIQDANNIAMAA